MKVQSRFIEMFGDTHVKSDNSRQWKEVVEIINGKDYKTIQVEDGGYPVYGTGGEMARAADYLSPANSILLGRKGTIDKPLLIKEKYWNVDTAFGAVPDENILNYVYFYWHCKTIDFNILNKGTTLPSTTKVDLLNLWVKIPAMEEQNRFASIVEQADKSEFVGFKSRFIEMFGNQDVNDRSWNESIVKDEFTLTMGKTPARNNPAFWQSGTNKWISISDMARYGRYTEDTQESITDIAVAESGIKIVPKGTIIMSFKLSIGRTAVTSEDIYTNEAIMAFRDVDETKFNMTFLQFLIANKNWLLNAKQAVKGQTLNKESIGNARIIVPPIGLQEQFAAIYNQADKSEYYNQTA